MAGGGLMQLVAYGAQDVYLSGNPQITFFKAVYKRHTNFSCEAITQTFSGSPDFGRRVTCPITRNGDLITKMYLVCKVTGTSSKKWAWTSQLGHAMIDNVELEDQTVVLEVQRGINSRSYKAGRYSPKHEKGLHHFHQLIRNYI